MLEHRICQSGEITFRLKEGYDFEWLKELGEVFAVFDEQDSGNISFGIKKDGRKLFLKFAGARTIHYDGEPAEAVLRLKDAVRVYMDLKHPGLIELVDHFEAGDHGYAVLFNWFEGENMHPHWTFPPPAKYTDPRSPFYKYRKLPVEKRLRSLDVIFDFHRHVEKSNYVAIDFYDGSILYDFVNDETRVCDIDLYEEKPFYNNMGRLWGSSRFMSPEEFELGAEIDSRSNVFNMGATAFMLLGGERDRSFDAWEAGPGLFQVASRAVQRDKADRYQTVEEFYVAWKEACSKAQF